MLDIEIVAGVLVRSDVRKVTGDTPITRQ